MAIIIRTGIESDFPQVLKLIQELADYENAPTEVITSVESMNKDAHLFEFKVAESDNKIIGIALYFTYYSTWKGRCIYLEDIVVTADYRRKGIGKLLFDEVILAAQHFGAKRLMWQVLDWNNPAIEFYKKINSEFDRQWLNCKLTEEQINNYPIS